MHITLIEPFYTGSHQQWSEGFQKYAKHEVEILSLKGRHWKWRMFGGAVVLARLFKEKIKHTDLILVSDMLDLTTFLGLVRKETTGIPVAIYFHENQLTYPWSPTDQDQKTGRKNEYAFMNYTSALAADQLFFNSQYHLNSFIEALPQFLKQFPDYNELENVEKIRAKSQVLHLGMDLSKFDAFPAFEKKNESPVILWNHRWEYDKNPNDFFEMLFRLKEERLDFQLIVLGEKYTRYPKIFDEAMIQLKENILHFGYAETFGNYASWLKTADILPVSSNQDFFGGSIVEAMYCGVKPLLPNRLAYPEHLEDPIYLYDSKEELFLKMKNHLLINQFSNRGLFKKWVEHYDWKNCISNYEEKMLIKLLS